MISDDIQASMKYSCLLINMGQPKERPRKILQEIVKTNLMINTNIMLVRVELNSHLLNKI